MRRSPLVLAAVCSLALAAPAVAAIPAGSLSQLPGTAGCITEDGSSNSVASLCADGRGLLGTEPVLVSPDGRFAYSYGYSDATIATFTRDPATGALSQADNTSGCLAHTGDGGLCTDSPFPGDDADTAHAIVLSPDGAYLFAAGRGVSAFRRDATTGALTPISGAGGCVSFDGKDADGAATCTTFANMGDPISLAISPDGRFLYAAGHYVPVGLAVLAVSTSGDLSRLPDPYGCFAATTTAGCTTSRYAGFGYDVAMSPDGRSLYTLDRDGAVVGYARDASSGTLTPLTGTNGCVYQGGPGPLSAEPCVTGHGLDSPNSLTVSPDGTLVTVGTQPSIGGGVVVLHRDTASGQLSQSAGAAGCVNVDGGDGCGTSRITDSTYQTTFTPDGRTLFAAAYGKSDPNKSGVSIFDVAADGTLTQRAGAAGCLTDVGGSCTAARGVAGATGFTIAPGGRFAYAGAFADEGVATFEIGLAPRCSDASAGTAHGTAVAIPVTCIDGNGDAVTLAGVDGPAHGAVTFGGLSATYTPAAGFSGADSFRMKGSDGTNDSAPATVSVSVGAGPSAGKQTPLKLSLTAKPKRDRKLPFKFRFSGRLTPAAGTTCSGKVVLTVRHAKKVVARKTATLAASCTWKATVTFKNRRKLGRKRAGKLVAKARFAGNAALNAKSSKALTVRYG